MLGKYLERGSESYIKRAGTEYTFFDLGNKWDEAFEIVNGNEKEIWRINKKFIDEQKFLGKEFYFSQNPWLSKSKEYLLKEAEYLIDLGAKDFIQLNSNTWKAIW